jgi:multidrug resistance efflux pump
MKLLLRILALLAVIFALYIIVGEQLVGSSGDAFVNARLAAVRSPQNGTLQLTLPPAGARVRQGEVLGNVVGASTADAELRSLERGLAEAEADVAVLEQFATDTSISALERERVRSRAAALRTQLDAQRGAVATRATSVLRSPVSGLMWSVRTNSSEYVPEAEVLLSVADCSGAFIHASVDQRLFNRLRVGDAAQFRFHGGDTIDVTVAMLAGTGPRTLLETLAITPTQRQLEGYAVMLAAPSLSAARDCPIGRTGRVIFSAGPLAAVGEFWSWIGF